MLFFLSLNFFVSSVKSANFMFRDSCLGTGYTVSHRKVIKNCIVHHMFSIFFIIIISFVVLLNYLYFIP